jgi:hypothetical protein
MRQVRELEGAVKAPDWRDAHEGHAEARPDVLEGSGGSAGGYGVPRASVVPAAGATDPYNGAYRRAWSLKI